MGNAIVTYATKVCAHVEDDDPGSLTEARMALGPIDAHREAQTRKAAPTTPEPDAPKGP